MVRWRRALAIALALVLAFVAATAWLFVWPAQGLSAAVSAIVVLAGPGDRLPVGLRLAHEHRADVLVVSQGWLGYGGPCPSAMHGTRVICFDPNPGTTRGEAEYVSRLANRYGWRSLVLVATQTQAVRAELLMRRCFSGSVYVMTTPLPVSSLPYQIAYGWGALLKALVVVTAC
jgi:uncharacterized SAM-binding protein YcdF (DUF218 family)